MRGRTLHAVASRQAGRRDETETRFREAERQSAYQLLYSLPGSRYCDLLLAALERAEWRAIGGSAGYQPAPVGNLPTGTEVSVQLQLNRSTTGWQALDG